MFWIRGALSVSAAFMAFVRSRQLDYASDLGCVSAEWLAEYRQSQES